MTRRVFGQDGIAHVQRRLLQGVLLAGLVSTAARRVRTLTPGGALTATAVGAAVYAGMGVRGSAALLTFFASSAVLGRLPGGERGAQLKGRERDAWQVLANGGIPALIAASTLAAAPSAGVICRFGGAVAAATADTWATEIGSRYGGSPRSVTTFKRLEPGVSGGVTLVGITATAAAAGIIACVASPPDCRLGKRRLAASMLVGGIAGSLLDSLLGATIQEMRYCDACQRETEQLVHMCNTPTRHLRGYAWCSNDTVNTLAIGSGALAASWMANRHASPHSPRAS